MPPTAPNRVQLVKKPRRLAGECSARYTIEPVYSPPTDRPWSMRMPTIRKAAAMPMVAWSGRMPITPVGIAISMTERTSARLRPILSPI